MESKDCISIGPVSTTAKDFFLHLGSMVGLYATAIAFLNLVFRIVDKLYPEIIVYYYNVSSISFPVATLIIVFPLFILLSWLINKTYEIDQNKKQLGIRKWLTYITLFVAGVILAGDLVFILYKFLDGQNLTTAFVLKALTIFVVSGAVFGFYLQDIREKVLNKKLWAITSSILIILAIVFGFSVIGSPKTQRLLRYDSQKVDDLIGIQMSVISFWQKKGILPENLNDLNDQISGYMVPKDYQTGFDYEYKKMGNMSFELCANFNLENKIIYDTSSPYNIYNYNKDQNWNHGAGYYCFSRTIDSELYPPIKNVR